MPNPNIYIIICKRIIHWWYFQTLKWFHLFAFHLHCVLLFCWCCPCLGIVLFSNKYVLQGREHPMSFRAKKPKMSVKWFWLLKAKKETRQLLIAMLAIRTFDKVRVNHFPPNKNIFICPSCAPPIRLMRVLFRSNRRDEVEINVRRKNKHCLSLRMRSRQTEI